MPIFALINRFKLRRWDSGKNAGFSSGDPWLAVNPNHGSIKVAEQEKKENSILNYYRGIIAFRKENPVLVHGDYGCLQEEHLQLVVYRRWDSESEFLILHNMGDGPQEFITELKEEQFELRKTNLLENLKRPFHLQSWKTKILD